jgi:conjugal transfer mating pair stabilization protein TraG
LDYGTPSTANQRILNYSLEERDFLIRTIAFEAPNESDKGKAAVAHVILNRKISGRWGRNVKSIVTQPWQFEPWMTRRAEIEKLSPDDPRYQKAALIADGVLAGEIPDPTAGATHFLNPVSSFGRGAAVPCHPGQVAKDCRSAGTPFTGLMRLVARHG